MGKGITPVSAILIDGEERVIDPLAIVQRWEFDGALYSSHAKAEAAICVKLTKAKLQAACDEVAMDICKHMDSTLPPGAEGRMPPGSVLRIAAALNHIFWFRAHRKTLAEAFTSLNNAQEMQDRACRKA